MRAPAFSKALILKKEKANCQRESSAFAFFPFEGSPYFRRVFMASVMKFTKGSSHR